MGAVVVRVTLTFATSQLLQLPFLQLVGGLLLVWIAFKLLRQDGAAESNVRHGTTLMESIRVIIIADLISVDHPLLCADQC